MSEAGAKRRPDAISITQTNRIWIQWGKEQAELDFNAQYHKFYPFCRFTAAEICGQAMYAAGTDLSGVPHLYVSSMGDVWSPVCILPQRTWISEASYGDVLKILYDLTSTQIFLVTRNGYLITLPDCPRCVRARRISDVPLKNAEIQDAQIAIWDVLGTEMRYALHLMAQYRCTWPFAKARLGKNGIVIDLRTDKESSGITLPGSMRLTSEAIPEFLRCIPEDMNLFFVCEQGWSADDAARESRFRGHEKSYSLGGAQDIFEEIRKDG